MIFSSNLGYHLSTIAFLCDISGFMFPCSRQNESLITNSKKSNSCGLQSSSDLLSSFTLEEFNNIRYTCNSDEYSSLVWNFLIISRNLRKNIVNMVVPVKMNYNPHFKLTCLKCLIEKSVLSCNF